MQKYHKIQTVWKRDPDTNYKTLIPEEWAAPEFDFLQFNEWIFTEKVDGMNVRIIWDLEKLDFRGKSDSAQMPGRLLEKLNERFSTEQFKELYPDTPMTIYGEGYGAKIQKGGDYIEDGNDFIAFDVLIVDNWLDRDNVEDVCGRIGSPVVPIIGYGMLWDAIDMCEHRTFKSQLKETPPEGLVMRPLIEMRTREGNRVISKLKLGDFDD